MAYKPVGADENGQFPPRVVTKLKSTIAGEVTDTSSATRAALNAGYAPHTALYVFPTGGADDTAVIQAKIDAATADQVVKLVGSFAITGTVTIKGNLDGEGAVITHSGAGPAVRIGATATSLRRANITLPRIIDGLNTTAGSWVPEKTGVEILNTDSCILTIPHISGFGVGVDLVGDGRGNAYNTLTIGHLDNNKVNFRVRALGVGWANQNTIIGGRYGHNSGEGTNVVGSRQVEIVASASPINNNLWVNPSMEGDVPEFHADISGTANMILNGRWEATTPKVRWQSGATNNQILYGYGLSVLVQTFVAGALRNHVWGASKIAIQTTSGMILESSGGDTTPAAVVMPSGGIAAGTSTTTGYAVKQSANATEMKRTGDAFPRVKLDHVNGRVYVGNGVADPALYFGALGTALGVSGVAETTTAPAAGGAGALPATPAGYMTLYINGTARKLPYY